MRVLIIPEDFRNDEHVLKPLFSRLFRTLGQRRARVEVCRDPLLGGVREALKSDRLAEIVRQHGGMTDIFILCVDRDGMPGRRQRLDEIEDEFGHGRAFLAVNAWEEIEVWVLAGLDLPNEWNWQDVRATVKVKEEYFEVVAARLNLASAPGGGRKALAEQASSRINAIRRKCPEDFGALAGRLEREVRSR